MDRTRPFWAPPLAALAIVTLMLAIWGGLLRVGWALPWQAPTLSAFHGPLLVAGVFGVLVGLERAVALGKAWTYLAPALAAAGSITVVAGAGSFAPILYAAAGMAFVLVNLSVYREHPSLHAAIETAGAAMLVIGSVIWLVGGSISDAVPAWTGFLLFTIVGERLELSRLLLLSRAQRMLLVGALAVYAAAIPLRWAAPLAGSIVAGLAMVAVAVWLFRYDLARRTIRRSGVTRYIAIALLSGFVWLLVAGILTMLGPAAIVPGAEFPATLANDATLHAFFVGFVFAMVFGHAPVVLPALGLPVAYNRWFYPPLVVLHFSVAVRIVGDLAGVPMLRREGAMGNGVAIALFFLTVAGSFLAGQIQSMKRRTR
ncbi:MAG: hypothetical protein U0556_12695 [Dehalococcoidia bacterium]